MAVFVGHAFALAVTNNRPSEQLKNVKTHLKVQSLKAKVITIKVSRFFI